jgi:hypothetical protein
MIHDRMMGKRGVLHPQTPLVQGQQIDSGAGGMMTGLFGGMLLGEVIEGIPSPYSASEGISADE